MQKLSLSLMPWEANRYAAAIQAMAAIVMNILIAIPQIGTHRGRERKKKIRESAGQINAAPDREGSYLFLLPSRRQEHQLTGCDATYRQQLPMADRDLYSGLVRLHVLYHASAGAVFGLGMIEELRRHGYRVGPGTLYPLLHGLERRGYLRSKKRLVEGKIRRVYAITKRGRRELVQAIEKVRELYEELVEGHGEPSPAHPGSKTKPPGTGTRLSASKHGGEGYSRGSRRL